MFKLPFSTNFRKFSERLRYVGCWIKAIHAPAHKARRRSFQLEAMENRVLLSATPVGDRQHPDLAAENHTAFTTAPNAQYFAELSYQPRTAALFSEDGSGTGGGQAVTGKDLIVTNFVVTDINNNPINGPVTVDQGTSLKFTWTVKNDGTEAITGAWYDDLVRSTDTTISYPGDPSIAFQRRTSLDAGASYSVTKTVTMNVVGSFFMGVDVDSEKEAPEWDGNGTYSSSNPYEQNNTAYRAVTVNPVVVPNRPDFIISSITTSPSSVAHGGSVNVTYTLKNIGDVSYTGEVITSFYLSRDNQLNYNADEYFGNQDVRNVSLAPNAEQSFTVTRTVSGFVSGTTYVIGETDIYPTAEGLESNNRTASAFTVTTPNVDLTPVSATHPTTLHRGEYLDFTLISQNSGTAAVGGNIYDEVFFSLDNVWDAADSFVGAAYNFNGVGAGASYTAEGNGRLSASAPLGSGFLLFVSNGSGQAGETNIDNNVLAKPVTVIASNVDLVITNVVLDAEGAQGSSVPISITVQNNGSAPTDNEFAVYIYQNGFESPSISGYVYSTAVIGAGASAIISGTLNIPQGVTVGQKTLNIIVDGNQHQHETNENNNATTRTFTVVQGSQADLAVSLVSAPSTAAVGQSINLQFDVDNIGEGPTPVSTWYDAVYLSLDANLGSDTLIGEYFHNGSVEEGLFYPFNVNLTIPNGYSGQVYLIFVADDDGVVTETNEGNNFYAHAINITAPDATISGATAPAAATLGSTINVSYNVNNIGNQSLPYSSQYFYISADQTFDPNVDVYVGSDYLEAALAAGGTVADSTSVYLQNYSKGIPTGAVYLVIQANAMGSAPEGNMTNNLVYIPITLSGPDLTIAPGATAPATLAPGQTFNVSYVLQNSGATIADLTWNDGIYLSSDATFDNFDILLDTEYIEQSIAAGATFPVTQSLTLSGNATVGNKYLIVRANTYGSQAESNLENNWVAIPINVVAPNVTVSNLSAPGTAAVGGTISVSYTVTNNGSVDVYVPFWDVVELEGGEFSAVYQIGSFSRPGGFVLAAGASTNVTRSVTVPDYIAGNYTLRVRVEAYEQLTETSENDNSATQSIQIQAPNLVVQEVTAPATVSTGQQFTVTYKVRNTGNVAVTESFSDRIRVTRVSTGVQLLEQVVSTYTPNIGPDGFITKTVTFTLPDGPDNVGNLLIEIENDYLNYVVEAPGQETNQGSTTTVGVLSPYPDLSITGMTLPNTIVSGQEVTVTYTVTNNGTRATAGNWYDYVTVENLDKGTTIFSQFVHYTESDANRGPILPGESRTMSFTLVVPHGAAGVGELQFNVQTNDGEAFYEYSAANPPQHPNIYSDQKASTLAPYADLVVENLALPANLASGQQITATWNLRNQGTAAISHILFERVQVKNLTTGQTLFTTYLEYHPGAGSEPALAAGNARSRSYTFTLPEAVAGTGNIQITVDADNLGGVTEYLTSGPNAGLTGELNNSATDTETSVLADYPDLVVNSVTPSTNPTTGQEMTLDWQLQNYGSKPVTTNFIDRIRVINTSLNDLVLLEFEVPYNAANTAIAANGVVNRSHNFVLPQGEAYFGNLRFEVITDATNAVYEYRPAITAELNNQASATAAVTLGPVADLQVTSISTEASALSNQDIEVEWTITNTGSGATLAGWADRLWLSADNIPGNAGDIQLGSFTYNGTLGAGESAERVQAVHIPIDLFGTFKVLVETDIPTFNGQANVLEANTSRTAEQNNLGVDDQSIAITLSPFPNLVTSNVQAAASVNTGQQTLVTWRVTNSGDAATSGLWRDSVFLSADPNWDDSDFFLGSVDNAAYLPVGEAYNSSLAVTVPQAIDGNYYFIVRSDATRGGGFQGIFYYTSQIYEGNEGDNTASTISATDVNLTPPPDLRVTVNGPSQVFSGQTVNISYTVTNHGPGATDISSWRDDLFLSSDDVLGGDISLGSYGHGPTLVRTTVVGGGYTEELVGGFLQPGESYTVTRAVTLPIGISGSYHFLVQTDATNALYEQALDGNNVGTDAVTVVLTPPPDLEVVSISTPANAEASRPFTFSYRVANNGASITPNSEWFDSYWLSLDGTLGEGDIHLGDRRHVGQLDTGDFYDNSATFTLPNGLSGNYRLIVRTDSGNAVFEGATGNDNNTSVSSGAIAIVSKPADLTILSSSISSTTGQAGGTLRVSWAVGNIGLGSTITGNWGDEIFISSSPTFDNTARRLDGFEHYGVLEPGQTYQRSELVNLPLDLNGAYYIFVRTNAGDRVFEGALTGANVAGPHGINIGQNIADLQVTAASAAPSALSGQTFTVSYTVKNLGNGPTNGNYWYDAIALARNANGSDIAHTFPVQHHGGVLQPNGEYTVNATFTVPIDLVGNFYVVVSTDVPVGLSSNQVYEGANEGNNFRIVGAAGSGTSGSGAPVTAITLGPVPDLAVTAVNGPTDIISGQPFVITWTVANLASIAASGSWYDSFYLSRDKVFDPANDIYVGNFRHHGGLAAGEDYDGSAQFTLDRGLSGTFYVFAIADSADQVYERTATANNRGYDPIATLVSFAPPADLDAGEITIPPNAQPGQQATFVYTVTNIGPNIAKGTWTDSLYLSLDGTYGLDDIFLGRVEHTGDVAANGGSYSHSLTVDLPGLVEGNWRVLVRSDIRNQVVESDETVNNFAASGAAVAVNVPSLTLGSTQNVTLQNGKTLFYKFTVTSGEALLLTLESLNNQFSNQLYVAYNRIPTPSNYDFTFTEANAADQEITVPISEAGTYYVMVRTVAGSSTSPGTLKVETIPFGVRKLDVAGVGNAGPSTIKLTGARYTADTQFTLVGPGGQLYPATRVIFADTSVAYATFDLTGAPLGAYDVKAEIPGGSTATLNDPLTVTTGVGGQIAVEFTGPGALRPGRPYVGYIEIANFGDADIAVPALILHNRNNLPIGLDADELQPHPLLHLVAASDDLLGGTLRPGERRIIPIFFRASADAAFDVIAIRPNDTTLADWSVVRQTIQEFGLMPSGLSAAEEAAAFAQLQAQVGPTWGDYVKMLGRNASLLTATLGDRRDALPLLALEVKKAVAAIGTSVTGQLQRPNFTLSVGDRDIILRNVTTDESYTTSTLADGTFIVPRVSPGSYIVEVVGGLVSAGGSFTVAAGQSLTGQNVTIVRGGEITGTATVGTSAQVLSGATLRLVGPGNSEYVVTTGSDGRYSFTGLSAGTYQLVADAPGRARLTIFSLVLATAASTITQALQLAPEARLVGTVTYPAGGPQNSPLIVRVAETGNPSNYFVASVTDHNYVVAGLPAGNFTLTYSAEGYLPATQAVTISTTGQITAPPITLQREATISGTVVGAGITLPPLTVVGLYQGDTMVRLAQVLPTGAYEFSGLQPGSYTVKILPYLELFSTEQSVTVTLGQQASNVEIRVLPGATIRGTVRDGNNQPLANVFVEVVRNDGVSDFTTTNAQGVYEFAGIGLGTYRVSVLGSDDAAATVPVTSLEGAPLITNLTAQAVATLGGTLHDAQGQILEGIATLYTATGEKITSVGVSADGSFNFYLQQPGLFTVVVTPTSGGAALVESMIVVQSGDHLVRNFTAGSGQLTIALTGGDAAGTTVTLRQDLPGDAGDVTVGVGTADGTGSVTFGNLTPGTYYVVAANDQGRGARAEVTFTGNGQTSTVALGVVGKLSGTVTVPAGVSLANGGLVQILNQDGTVGTFGRIESDGSYAFDYLAPGTYELIFLVPGAQRFQATGVAVSGAVDHDVTLTASTTTLTGIVRNGASQPLGGVLVVVTDEFGRTVGHTATNADGTYTITTAVGVDLRVIASMPGRSLVQSGLFSLAPGGTLAVPALVLGGVAFGAQAVPLGGGGSVAPGLSDFIFSSLKFINNLSPQPGQHEDHVTIDMVPLPCSPEAAQATATEERALMNAIKFQDMAYDSMIEHYRAMQMEYQLAGTTALVGFWETMGNFAQAALAFLTPVGKGLSALGGAARAGAGGLAGLLSKLGSGAVNAAANAGDYIQQMNASLRLANDLGQWFIATKGLVDSFFGVKTAIGEIFTADEPEDAQAIADGAKNDLINFVNSVNGFWQQMKVYNSAERLAQTLATDSLGVLGAFLSPVAFGLAANDGIAKLGKLRDDLSGAATAGREYKKAKAYYEEKVKLSDQALDRYIAALEEHGCDPEDPDDDEEEEDDDEAENPDGTPWAPVNPRDPASPFAPGAPRDPAAPGNGVAPYRAPVLVSRDPNDILGPVGFGPENWISSSQRLDYTIRFENEETTSGAAQEVVVTQYLDPDLDWRTFRLDDFGFGDLRIELPGTSSFYSGRVDLMAERGFVVDVFAFIDVDTGLATWRLTTIDPATGDKPADATLGFLPPNETSPEGEGFLTYSVRPKATAATGAVIDAQAEIVFDINEPIITPAIFHTLDANAPTSAVTGLGATQGSSEFTVAWTGADTGAGLATFDVYVSDDGGDWQLWLEKTALAEAVWAGQTGHSYRFYTVAFDNAGNAQANNPASFVQTTVNGISNRAPVLDGGAGTRTVTATEDGSSVSLGIVAPTDADGDTLYLSISSIPTVGKGLLKKANGDLVTVGSILALSDLAGLTFTPTANSSGAAGSFRYVVNDGKTNGVSQTINLQITAQNDLPTAQGDKTLTHNEDSGSVPLGITAPTDVDGDTLTITVTSVPTTGKGVVRRADGSIVANGATLTVEELTGLSFSPGFNAFGSAGTFGYSVYDGQGGTAEQLVTFALTGVNDAPTVAGTKTVTVLEDSTATNLGIVAPSDVDGDTLTIQSFTLPSAAVGVVKLANGTIVTAGTALTVADLAGLTFTPALNANGPAGAFSYTVADGNGGTGSQTVTLNVTPVNDAPTVAANTTLTVLEDATPTNLGLAAPTDIENDTLTITVTGLPSAAHGTVRLANGDAVANGAALTSEQLLGLTFTPALNANGAAGQFSYSVNDGNGGISSQSITIGITPVNDAPTVGSATLTRTYAEDSGTTALGIPAPADVDGDTLTVTITAAAAGRFKLANGNVLQAGSVLTVAELQGVTYTTAQDVNGAGGTLAYTITDPSNASVTQSISITLTPVNDAPVAEAPGTITLAEDAPATALNLPMPTDVDGDTLTVRVDSLPSVAKGTLRLNGNALSPNQVLSLVDFAALTFTPALNENGAAGSFGYTILDGQGGSAPASATISLTPVNDTPTVTASTLTRSVAEDSGVTGLNLPAPSDVDGDTLTVTITGAAAGRFKLANGNVLAVGSTLTVAELAGVTYTTTVLNEHGAGGTLAYTISDSSNASVNQSVTVTITPVNDAPTSATPAPLTLQEDAPATALALTVPTDVDGTDTLTARVDALPLAALGTVRLANGNAVTLNQVLSLSELAGLTFTPVANNYGAAGNFTYTILDNQGGTLQRSQSITITAVNDAPVTENDRTVQVTEDTTVSLNIAPPTDVDPLDTLTITVTALPSASIGVLKLLNGSVVTLNQALTPTQLNQLRFEPVANVATGTTTFTYSVTDGTLADTQTITLVMNAVNDAPVVGTTTTITVVEDSAPNPLNLAAPTDVDGDSLTISVTQLPGLAGSITLANGTAVTAGQTLTIAQLQGLRFQPTGNAAGAGGTFIYTVSDGQGASVPRSIVFEITGTDDQPFVDADKTITVVATTPTTALNIAPPQDIDGDTVTVTVTEVPDFGTVTLPDGTVLEVGDLLTPAQVATLQFRPSPSVAQGGTFSYSVNDGTTVQDSTVTIEVARAVTTITKTFSFNDANGDKVTISIAGGGTLEAELANGQTTGADLYALRILGSNAKTTVTVTVAKGKTTSVGSVTTGVARQDVGALTLGAGVQLGGTLNVAEELRISGTLKTLTLDDVAADSALNIGSALSITDVSSTGLKPKVTLGDILGNGVALTVQGGILSVTAASWGFAGAITALQSVGAITTTVGDFHASLSVGANPTAPGTATLGLVNVLKGNLRSPSIVVEGAVAGLSALKGEVTTSLVAASLAKVSAKSLVDTAFVATTGNIGPVTAEAWNDVTITAAAGTVGALTAKPKLFGADAAMREVTVLGKSIGNIAASISVPVTATSTTAVWAIVDSAFTATAGNIGSITATAGTTLTAVHATGLQDSTFSATGSIGAVSATATHTSRAPSLAGSAVAIRETGADDVSFIAGGLITSLKATATGAGGDNLALLSATGSRIEVLGTTSVGALTFTATRNALAGSTAVAVQGLEVVTSGAITSFSIAGNHTANAGENVHLTAGTKIGPVKVASTTKPFGTLSGTTIAAGGSLNPATALEMKNASFGGLTLSGSLLDSTIAATGNLGAISIGGNLVNSFLLAGMDLNANGFDGDETVNAHGAITSVKVTGAFTSSTIVAGISAGADDVYGTADDVAGTANAGLPLLRSSIGIVTFGATSVASSVTTPFIAAGEADFSSAIASFAVKSVKVGLLPARTSFTESVVIDANANGVADFAETVIYVLPKP